MKTVKHRSWDSWVFAQTLMQQIKHIRIREPFIPIVYRFYMAWAEVRPRRGRVLQQVLLPKAVGHHGT